jgi:DNA-binding phage protein
MNPFARQSVVEALRLAIRARGGGVQAVARQSGVDQSVLHRFLSGERGITIETAEKICSCLDLELRPTIREAILPETRDVAA